MKFGKKHEEWWVNNNFIKELIDGEDIRSIY
jgi:hypothetical protein